MEKLVFPLLGEKWTAFYHEEESYIKKEGEDTAAVTILSKKEIHFNKEDFSEETVRHECFHLFAAFQTITSANLTSYQTEEVFAEMFGKWGEEMVKTSRKLFNFFKKGPKRVTRKRTQVRPRKAKSSSSSLYELSKNS